MSGIGKILRAERDKRGFTLEDVSQKTNINENILQALENGEFQKIPGKFYLINFLKSYLTAIGLDQDDFFKTHKTIIQQIRCEGENDPKLYYNKLRYTRFKKRNLLLLLLLCLGLLALLVFLGYRYRDTLDRVTGRTGPRMEIPVTGAMAVSHLQAFEPDRYPITLTIRANDDCWLQAFRGNKKVAEQVLRQGDHRQIKGYDLLVLIGNPAAVMLEINGHPITRFQNRTRTTRLRINPQNLTDMTSS